MSNPSREATATYQPVSALDTNTHSLGDSRLDPSSPATLPLRTIDVDEDNDEDDDNTALEEFFVVDDGRCALEDLETMYQSEGATDRSLTRVATTISFKSIASARSFCSFKTTYSAATVIPSGAGGYGVPLEHLCRLITSYPSLQHAEIFASECYTKQIVSFLGFSIVHRYLVLELRREGKKTLWVRLDRTPDRAIGVLSMMRFRGNTKANDVARLTGAKQDLIQGDYQENQQNFAQPPTLGTFCHLLEVVRAELTVYKLWPQNCWFFVSLLQEHLGWVGSAVFAFGSLPVPDLELRLRHKILGIAVAKRLRNASPASEMFRHSDTTTQTNQSPHSTERSYAPPGITTAITPLLSNIEEESKPTTAPLTKLRQPNSSSERTVLQGLKRESVSITSTTMATTIGQKRHNTHQLKSPPLPAERASMRVRAYSFPNHLALGNGRSWNHLSPLVVPQHPVLKHDGSSLTRSHLANITSPVMANHGITLRQLSSGSSTGAKYAGESDNLSPMQSPLVIERTGRGDATVPPSRQGSHAQAQVSIPATEPLPTTSPDGTTRIWRSTLSRVPASLSGSSVVKLTSPTDTQVPATGNIPPPRRRELSLPSLPTWDLFPSYSNLTEREARLKRAQEEFEAEIAGDGDDLCTPQHDSKRVWPPKPFAAMTIPPSERQSPFAFLSRNKHARALSSASKGGSGRSETMGSESDVESRSSSYISEITSPPFPDLSIIAVGECRDNLPDSKGRPRRPGVTFDIDTGSPKASFAKLMKLDGEE